MYLIQGVTKEENSDYVLYFIENLSDELKEEIRNRLVAVCYGADQAQSALKIYSYKEACRNWWSCLSEGNKQVIQQIPNFDPEVFQEITGIDVKRDKEV